MSKLERLRQIIGRSIIDVEYIESGVSNYYAFTLDDKTILRMSHDDSEGAVWIDTSRTKTIICAEGKENEEP